MKQEAKQMFIGSHMTDSELWSLFVQRENIKETEYKAWAFGGTPDKLAKLVIAGIKTATASAYPLYEFENEPLPKEGGYSVILNSNAEAVCVIKTTKVSVVPFSQVTQEHARKEGEGDKSLEYWQKMHRIFFEGCLQNTNLSFDESMLVVCEEFQCIYVA